MKTLVQLLGAMFAAIMPLTQDPGAPLDNTIAWINVGVIAAGSATVYIAANADWGVWSITKTFMSLISVVGVAAISVFSDGVMSTSDWFQVGSALMAAVAVYGFPKDFQLTLDKPAAAKA